MTADLQIAALAALALILIAIGLWIVFRHKNTPEKRERRRRILLSRTGRLGDGFITETSDDAIFYSYSVGGVSYTASQEIGTLHAFLPPGHDRLIGHTFIKYAPRNPANSILLCEEWSGIREPAKQTLSEAESVG